MNEFEAYLRLGFAHITDLNGYDHILFVVALCTIYQLPDWKRILVLVTAFTLGHSITLAMATLQVFSYSAAVIEFLIPITILVTSISNFSQKSTHNQVTTSPSRYLRYGLALGFGLIHGLGFSNYLRSLLGQEGSIVQPLLAFNIGLEFGQLCIVGVFLVLSYVFTRIFHVSRRDWMLVLSAAVAGISLTLIHKAWIF